MGHPDYLPEGGISPIQCAIKEMELDKIVEETKDLSNKWSADISELQSTYTWLLYFSIPKMLQLYNLIFSSHERIYKLNKIFHEISFLFSQNSVAEGLRNDIEVHVY